MQSSKLLNKFKNFKKIDKIYRVRKELSRFKKIRLDKNERLNDFESYFINKIKNIIKIISANVKKTIFF